MSGCGSYSGAGASLVPVPGGGDGALRLADLKQQEKRPPSLRDRRLDAQHVRREIGSVCRWFLRSCAFLALAVRPAVGRSCACDGRRLSALPHLRFFAFRAFPFWGDCRSCFAFPRACGRFLAALRGPRQKKKATVICGCFFLFGGQSCGPCSLSWSWSWSGM